MRLVTAFADNENTIHWADRYAVRAVGLVATVVTGVRVDDINFIALSDRCGGAFGFACAAIDAIFSDVVCHGTS